MCVIMACMSVSESKHMVQYGMVQYGHWIKPEDRNMVGKVLEIKDTVLLRCVTYGQGSY